MKIGIYDPYLDDLGGGEKYMLTIALCLAKEHDVTLFWDEKADILALEKRFGMSLHSLNLQKNVFSSSVGFFERMMATKRYDILIVLSDGSVPLVFSRKLFLHIQQPLPKKQTVSWKERIKCKRITEIFYNSEFTKEHNAHYFSGVKWSILYPPVVTMKLPIVKENIILHVGRFRVNKQQNGDFKKQGVMIETFKKMVDEGLKDWHFVLAVSVKNDDETMFALMQEKAKGYPIGFHINKTNEELYTLYNRAKIYWHASGFGEERRKHPELFEHFGMSTVEAMGAGCVPVVINAGGQKEIVSDGESGLLWNTLDELKQETKHVITDVTLWKKLSQGAIARSHDFTRERFCEQVERMIIG
jgi:glycosyltransferase involved in cell wall biosynthesis